MQARHWQFWSVIREFRLSWKRTTFWLWIVAFMGAHLVAYVSVLAPIAEWRLIWFLPLCLVGFAALVFLFDLLGTRLAPPISNVGRGTAAGSADGRR